jgi:hypothetical protein
LNVLTICSNSSAQGQVLSTENRLSQTKRRRRKAATDRGVTRVKSKRFS